MRAARKIREHPDKPTFHASDPILKVHTYAPLQECGLQPAAEKFTGCTDCAHCIVCARSSSVTFLCFGRSAAKGGSSLNSTVRRLRKSRPLFTLGRAVRIADHLKMCGQFFP